MRYIPMYPLPPCKHGIGPHLLGIFGISLPYSKGIIFREENSAQYECQTVTMQYLGVSNYDKPVRYSVMRIISQICSNPAVLKIH